MVFATKNKDAQIISGNYKWNFHLKDPNEIFSGEGSHGKVNIRSLFVSRQYLRNQRDHIHVKLEIEEFQIENYLFFYTIPKSEIITSSSGEILLNEKYRGKIFVKNFNNSRVLISYML